MNILKTEISLQNVYSNEYMLKFAASKEMRKIHLYVSVLKYFMAFSTKS
jgi:hypothetical protein